MAVEIGLLQPEEQDEARRLILAGMEEYWGVLDESKNPDLKDIMKLYADGVFLVAEKGGEIVGTGAYRPVSDEEMEVVRMSVQKRLRRQGIGRQILEELCRRACREGYKKVMLETTAPWEGVIAFYKAFGFEVTHYADGNVYFVLELGEAV